MVGRVFFSSLLWPFPSPTVFLRWMSADAYGDDGGVVRLPLAPPRPPSGVCSVSVTGAQNVCVNRETSTSFASNGDGEGRREGEGEGTVVDRIVVVLWRRGERRPPVRFSASDAVVGGTGRFSTPVVPTGDSLSPVGEGTFWAGSGKGFLASLACVSARRGRAGWATGEGLPLLSLLGVTGFAPSFSPCPSAGSGGRLPFESYEILDD